MADLHIHIFESDDDELLRRHHHHHDDHQAHQPKLALIGAVLGVLLFVGVAIGLGAYISDSSSIASSSPTSPAAQLTATVTNAITSTATVQAKEVVEPPTSVENSSSSKEPSSAKTTAKTSAETTAKTSTSNTGTAVSSTAASKTAAGSSSGSSGGSSSAKATGSATAAAASSSASGTQTASGLTLVQSCVGASFFDCFGFFTDADPTNGQVTFVSQSDAQSSGLASSGSNWAYIATDSISDLSSNTSKRNSIRLAGTKNVERNSLMLADFTHVPYGCSVWPAFWANNGVGDVWPAGGEIDTFEGVNSGTTNLVSLHTDDSSLASCTIDPDAAVADATTTDTAAAGCYSNAGCSWTNTATNSYGTGFNEAGGGVFATLFTDDAISSWFFTRADIPSDLPDNPDYSSWGDPQATWGTKCDVASYFTAQQMIFDITLCGDWAGQAGVWSADTTCSAMGATCGDVVQTGSNFKEAYFNISYVKVYELPASQ